MANQETRSSKLIRVSDPTYVFLIRERDRMTEEQGKRVDVDDVVRVLAGERAHQHKNIGANYRVAPEQSGYGDIFRLRLQPPPNGDPRRTKLPER